MKALMIHAWNEQETSYRGRFSNLLSYPSLTLSTLYSLIPSGVFEKIDVIDENSQKVRYDKDTYDLVLISFETSSSKTAYKHCMELKKRGSYIVCGGYHATALPEEVAQYCDTVIAGPAEVSLPLFIQDFIQGTPKKFYKNKSFCATEYKIPSRDRITKRKKLKIPAMLANPGCFNTCKYCSMRTMWENNPRPVEDVIHELKTLKTKMAIFYDPNFFGNRDYAISLMEAMKPLKIRWASNATADFGYDDELMKLAYESGCRGVLIGLESMNVDSLTSVAKRFSKAEKYKELIARIHRYGIAVNGCFVLGFDHDTEEELLQLPKTVEYLGLDLCRFAILTPYPGTVLFRELERDNRILTKDWSLYNQHLTVFQPKQITAERLDEIYRIVWKEAYTWRRVFGRVIHSAWRKKPYVLILLGANIGFKFLGIKKRK
jgi:radical SAM superfamily enzyme YgiQ (UPF0313 family)